MDIREEKKIKHFTDLIAWIEAHKLVLVIYQISKNLPDYERYGIINQIQRAGTSITANIAEGFGRYTYKDKIRFYIQARGSVLELENFLITIRDLKYINEKTYISIWKQCEKVATIINGLIKSTKKYIK